MILIICDTWKSLWSFIFPVVALANSNVATTSDFCQASGFFFAFGIEAAGMCSVQVILFPHGKPADQEHRFLYLIHCNPCCDKHFPSKDRPSGQVRPVSIPTYCLFHTRTPTYYYGCPSFHKQGTCVRSADDMVLFAGMHILSAKVWITSRRS